MSTETGIPCPRRMCPGEIIYNGNYFCERLGNGCDWALSHGNNGEPIGKVDKAVWEQLKAKLGLK